MTNQYPPVSEPTPNNSSYNPGYMSNSVSQVLQISRNFSLRSQTYYFTWNIFPIFRWCISCRINFPGWSHYSASFSEIEKFSHPTISVPFIFLKTSPYWKDPNNTGSCRFHSEKGNSHSYALNTELFSSILLYPEFLISIDFFHPISNLVLTNSHLKIKEEYSTEQILLAPNLTYLVYSIIKKLAIVELHGVWIPNCGTIPQYSPITRIFSSPNIIVNFAMQYPPEISVYIFMRGNYTVLLRLLVFDLVEIKLLIVLRFRYLFSCPFVCFCILSVSITRCLCWL